MLKTKKKVDREDSLIEEDIKFEKIIQFSGWAFLFALILFMGAWILLDFLLNIIELELNASTFSFIIFTGTNSAISFGLATRVKNNRDQKKKLYYDWLVGEFLFCMFAIFAIAAYQW